MDFGGANKFLFMVHHTVVRLLFVEDIVQTETFVCRTANGQVDPDTKSRSCN